MKVQFRRTGFRPVREEPLLKFRLVRIGAPSAALEGVDIGHILRGNFEIENLGVGKNTFGIHRLGKRDDAMLEYPPQRQLAGIFPVFFAISLISGIRNSSPLPKGLQA